MSAAGEARKHDRVGDVRRLDQAARGRAVAEAGEHRLLVGEVVERAGLHEAGRDRVRADPLRRVARPRGSARATRSPPSTCRRASSCRARGRCRGSRSRRSNCPRAWTARRGARARRAPGHSRSSSSPSASPSARRSAGSPRSPRSRRGRSAGRRPRPARARCPGRRRCRAGASASAPCAADLLGRLLGGLVVAQVADRDLARAQPGEAERDRVADPAASARHEDGRAREVVTARAGAGGRGRVAREALPADALGRLERALLGLRRRVARGGRAARSSPPRRRAPDGPRGGRPRAP